MAPRGNVKKGDRRVDAALDAMHPYGFDLKVVRLTIRELLKVYDGEWRFMEEDSYKLLIETIIEKQENEEQNLLEAPDGAGTSAMREIVASDVPEPLSTIPSIGQPSEPNKGGSNLPRLEESTQPAESCRYPRRNRRSRYAERVRNILGVTKSHNYSKDRPCKRRFCYGYLVEGEQDDLIEVEPQPDASASLPVSLLRSYCKQKQSTNPGPSRPPGFPPIRFPSTKGKSTPHPN
ncbi:hypothetical protein MLD38_002670 [Melastoma candidum]|uniref:Uncharacterized protein n=1 Tax=Melastoma candidum TaxID=119954 RepID=A0ACB9S4I2_9MYRT|nr:hypothetical protein MLD38_002670 [Melastoma candidum]